MNNTEKIIVLGTFSVIVLYIVFFNLNFAHYWNNSPRIIPEKILSIFWVASLLMSVITLIVCIRDSGKRNLESRSNWIIYMILFGSVGVPHYYFKYGRHPRA